MKDEKKILITKDGKKFVFNGADVHTQFGFIKKGDIAGAKPGQALFTNTGKEMFAVSASFIDLYNKMKQGPQIIPIKDIAKIVAFTGINSSSVVLEAGTGSGKLCCFLANIAKKVYSYEIRDDFFNIAKKNIEFLGLKNVVLKNKNIYDGVSEKGIDLAVFDLPEPWKAIAPVKNALKPGAFLVSYSPAVPQVMDFVDAVKNDKDFIYLTTFEIIEREWEVNARKVRPKSQPIGHSGFLSFSRKI